MDLAKDAVQMIKKNIAALGCENETDVYCMKDTRALELLSQQKKKFKAVYLDPPYAKQHNPEILRYIDEHEMMDAGGVLVIESDRNDRFTENYTHLKYLFDKEYGITRITYYRYEA